MQKKDKWIVALILIMLIFNICGIFQYVQYALDVKIESRKVWITTDVISSLDDYTIHYFVRYDDHNGEEGILWTDKNGYGMKKGDVVTVYRSVSDSNSTDSTHGWGLEKASAERKDFVRLIFFIGMTIVSTIILIVFVRKFRKKRKETLVFSEK